MSNDLYPIGMQRLLNKELDLDTDTITALLIDSADYTYSTAHDDLADVAGAAQVATANLASLTITNGTFDSADFSWTSVTGDQSEAIILYDNTHANDALILYLDSSITGMPVTPSGGNINVTVNASGWFALT